jgi:hypothetical protein
MQNSPEIFCPSCKHKNPETAVFCVYCQAPLSPFSVSDKTTDHLPIDTKVFASDALGGDAGAPPTEGIIFLHPESGQQTSVEHAAEFILGRKVDEQSENLIDLTPFGAYESGVSRLHAFVQKTETGYSMIDLDSTNGTWIDNEKLPPRKAFRVASGSSIRLGKLQLVALFVQSTA